MEQNTNMNGFEEMENAPDFEEMDWKDEISQDSNFILLPEGDYDFVIDRFERGRYEGGKKIGPCKMAIVHLKIKGRDRDSGREGDAFVTHRLMLNTKLESFLCEFFVGIGQRKKGESKKMNWNLVPGSTGRAKIGIRTYNGKEYNEVKKFYDPADAPAAAVTAPQNPNFMDGDF